jgi:hypothetical protein
MGSAGPFLGHLYRVDGYGDQALTCYIVGTRLQFSYLGSGRYEPSALKMLASLH